jgi:hypothetical protein
MMAKCSSQTGPGLVAQFIGSPQTVSKNLSAMMSRDPSENMLKNGSPENSQRLAEASADPSISYLQAG